MANILSRFMTEAHADRLVMAFCFFLTICVFGFLVLVTLLGDSRLRQRCSSSVTEKGHVVLETHTYALWSVIALRISSLDSRVS